MTGDVRESIGEYLKERRNVQRRKEKSNTKKMPVKKECYVQMAALVSKTLVGEKRRTWCSICQSVIMRPFNMQALRRRVEEDSEKGRV